MRDVGHQLAPQPVGVLQPLGHRVERARKSTHRRRSLLVHPNAVVAARDTIRRIHHRTQRRREAAHCAEHLITRPIATASTTGCGSATAAAEAGPRRNVEADANTPQTPARAAQRREASASTNRARTRRSPCQRCRAGHGSPAAATAAARRLQGRGLIRRRTCIRRRSTVSTYRGVRGSRLQLAAQVLDVRVDGAVERLDLLAADRVEQLAAREHASRLAASAWRAARTRWT